MSRHSQPGLMGIGELAKRSGKRRSALRYYEDIGLLSGIVRVDGQRRYPVGIFRTLAVIEAAQSAGLRLDEIKPLLDTSPNARGRGVERLREAAARRLPVVETQLARTALARDWLVAAAHCRCPTLDECGLFDNDTTDAGGLNRQPCRPR